MLLLSLTSPCTAVDVGSLSSWKRLFKNSDKSLVLIGLGGLLAVFVIMCIQSAILKRKRKKTSVYNFFNHQFSFNEKATTCFTSALKSIIWWVICNWESRSKLRSIGGAKHNLIIDQFHVFDIPFILSHFLVLNNLRHRRNDDLRLPLFVWLSFSMSYLVFYVANECVHNIAHFIHNMGLPYILIGFVIP